MIEAIVMEAAGLAESCLRTNKILNIADFATFHRKQEIGFFYTRG